MRVLRASFRPLLVALLFLLEPASEVAAHGGAFRGPPGRVPPRRGDPRDPPPPPPPGSPAPGPLTPAGKRPRARPVGDDDWTHWYHHNSEPIEEMKRSLYSFVAGPSSIFEVGRRGNPDKRGDAQAPIRELTRTLVVPALVGLIENREVEPTIRVAALLALGKVAHDPVHVATLTKPLLVAEKEHPDTQAAAALGLGLLRRTRISEQQPMQVLDRVRKTLFQLLEDPRRARRVRVHAGLAVGLLGDQPSNSESAVTARLLQLPGSTSGDEQVLTAVFVALGLHPPSSFSEEQRVLLRKWAGPTRERLPGQTELVACAAIHALGHVGTSADIERLIALFRRRASWRTPGSSALALGRLAARVGSNDRARIGTALTTLGPGKRANRADYLALPALADLAIAEVRASDGDVTRVQRVGELLLRVTESGRHLERAHAALALSRLGRELGEENPNKALATLRAGIETAIRTGLVGKALPWGARAAFAIGAGLLRDESSEAQLLAWAADEAAPATLSAHAALGLGLRGYGSKRVRNTLRVLVNHQEHRAVRHLAAKALALMGSRETGALQLGAFAAARTDRVRGEILVSVGETGVETEVEPVLALMRDESQSHFVRARACAALGRICDLELQPSLSLLIAGTNHKAKPALFHEVWQLQ